VGVIQAPAPLAAQHELTDFDSGQPALNDWLKKRVLKATPRGASARTFVVCDQDQTVLGYYALASSSVSREDAASKVSRNSPDPVPVILLARLAVDLRCSGQGLGRGLLKDAFLRAYAAAEHIGVRAMVVHALDEQVRSFYLKHGFYDSPTNDMTLMLTISEIEQALR
jgi:GNAT superfamily N-acetyltransferase